MSDLSTNSGSTTRDALMDAAEELFAEYGYAGTGIREIADEAGTNVASISYHFGSKSELYLATVRRSMSDSHGAHPWSILREPAVSGRDDAALRVARFIFAFFEHLDSEPRERRSGMLMLREALQPSEAVDAVVQEHVLPVREGLHDLIGLLLRDEDRPELTWYARALLAQLLHYHAFGEFIRRIDGPAATPSPALAAHIFRYSMRAMRQDEDLIDRTLARTPSGDPVGERE